MRLKPSIPPLEGRTPWERLDFAFKKVLTVPKEGLLQEEKKQKAQKSRRRILAKKR
jgi:hypothetical protein